MMLYKGMLIGSIVGSLTGNPLLSLVGAIVGGWVERMILKGRAANGGCAGMPPNRRAMVFCASTAAMLAKIAKADGHVTADEISGVERAFVRLGFSRSARDHAVRAFRMAKDDARSIYDYAREFAAAVNSTGVRELLYEILWDIAASDGVVGPNELIMLQRLPRALGIRQEWFDYHRSRHTGESSSAPAVDTLESAYRLLDLSPSDDVETLKRRYRELAKKNHPDALRAQGLPEEMVGKATERMSRINAAWAAIRAARGI